MNIKWFNLNNNGHIINPQGNIVWPLEEKAGIYIYKYNYGKKNCYVGSTINIKRRFWQHRYRARLYEEELKYNSMLYNYVLEYGWENFQYGVVQYVEFKEEYDCQSNKKRLLLLEQKYLDLISPGLNTLKYAGSMLGFKHSKETKENYKILRSNRCYRKIKGVIIKPDTNKETILKLKLHNKRKVILLFKQNKLINEFITIRDTANFVKLSPTSVSKYIKSGKLWKEIYSFKLEIKTVPLDITFPLDGDCEEESIIQNIDLNNKRYSVFEVFNGNKLLYRFKSINSASKYLNISKRTLMIYSKSNKLWKDKFKFNIIHPMA